MDVAADVRVVGVQLEIGTIGEPIGIVKSRGSAPLPEHDFPQSRMEIGIDGIENGLCEGVGAFQMVIMQIGVFVINNLPDRLDEIRGF